MDQTDAAVRDTTGVRTARRPEGRRPRKPRRMPAGVRKMFLAVHVVSSVGWLGLSIGNLALVLTALSADRPEVQHAVLRSLAVLGDLLLIPISWTALLSGLLLSVGTHWGVLRYWWVLAKLVLTVVPIVLIPMSLLPGNHELVAVLDATPHDRLVDLTPSITSGLLGAACVSLTMYTVSAVLSVVKPWGRTPLGVKAATAESARRR